MKPAQRHCIYCRRPLSADESPAHVLFAALGGRKKSRDTVCTPCNGLTSRDERVLAESLRFITGALGVKQGDGDTAPAVRLPVVGGDPVLVSGGKITGIGGPPELSWETTGTTRVKLASPPDLNHAALAITHLLRRLGKTPDDLLNGSADVQLSHSFCFRPQLEFTISLGRDEHQRAIAKIAFELLAYHRADLAHRPELDGVRAIIGLRTGIPDVSLDLHSLGSGLLLNSSLPTFIHTVEVWSAGKFLAGKVTLFGFLPFTIAFTDQWAAGPIRIAYAIDPLNPTDAREFSDELNGTLPASWPQRLGQSSQEIDERMSAFAGAYLKRLNELCLEQTVQDIMDIWKVELRKTVMPGEPIPIESINRVIALAADFGSRMRWGGERKEPIPIQAILPKIREHYARLSADLSPEGEANS